MPDRDSRMPPHTAEPKSDHGRFLRAARINPRTGYMRARHPVAAGGAGVAILLIAGVALYMFWQYDPSPKAKVALLLTFALPPAAVLVGILMKTRRRRRRR